MCQGEETVTLTSRETRQTASSLAEGGEVAESKPSRRDQVTVWSNSRSGSGTGANGSKTGVWSNTSSQAGGPRAGERTGA